MGWIWLYWPRRVSGTSNATLAEAEVQFEGI